MTSPSPPLRAGPITWGLAATQFLSWGAIYYSFAVFIVPMEADLGWSRASLSAALALGLVTAGLAAPLVGAWIDRAGGRGPMTFGSVLAAAMLVLWSLQDNYLLFCLSWVGLGIAQALTLYEPAFATLHRELGARAPGAIARVTLVGGLASTAFVPLSYWLVEAAGWRNAVGLLALPLLAICAPLHVMLPSSPHPPRAPAQPAPSPLRAAVRSRPFWGLLATYAGGGAVFGAVTFHIIPLLLERGMEGAAAVALVATIGPLQVAGRLGVLVLWRDISARTLGRVVTAGLPLSIMILIYSSGVAGALVFAILYGVSNGLTTILRGTAAAELLGREGFGAINGTLGMPVALAKAAAPAVAGIVWAWSGGYGAVLWVLFGIASLSTAAFWWASAKTPRRPARPEAAPN